LLHIYFFARSPIQRASCTCIRASQACPVPAPDTGAKGRGQYPNYLPEATSQSIHGCTSERRSRRLAQGWWRWLCNVPSSVIRLNMAPLFSLLTAFCGSEVTQPAPAAAAFLGDNCSSVDLPAESGNATGSRCLSLILAIKLRELIRASLPICCPRLQLRREGRQCPGYPCQRHLAEECHGRGRPMRSRRGGRGGGASPLEGVRPAA
jgi:hypothetical protein